MTNVSKNRTKDKIDEKILKYFLKVTESKSSKEIWEIFNSLLTANKKIMIRKRMGILFMLNQGKSYRKISRALDVDYHTISYAKKGFVKTPAPKRKYAEANVSHCRRGKFLPPPPIVGRGRWKFLSEF